MLPFKSSHHIAVTRCPEADILLCCARTQMDAASAERLRLLLQDKIDWDDLLGMALQNGMTPLLYWQLNAICPEAVPHSTLAALQDDFCVNAHYNVFLMEKLLKLLSLFEAHNISAVPFKGPILAIFVYDNLALREFSDLDILIHPRDLMKAKALLVSQGYGLQYPLSEAQETDHLQSHHAYTFVSGDGEVSIDLHWRFAPRHYAFALGLEHLWERLAPAGLAGTTISTISVEDLLLILSMHGAKDGWARLIWICDIAELIRAHREINWAWVIEQAETLGSERRLWLGLHLASQLLGAELPPDILRRALRQAGVKSLAAQVCQRLFCTPERVSDVVGGMLLNLRAMDHLRDKLVYFRYRLRQLLTPNRHDRALLALPVHLSFLYYLLRLLRLMRVYGRMTSSYNWYTITYLLINDTYS